MLCLIVCVCVCVSVYYKIKSENGPGVRLKKAPRRGMEARRRGKWFGGRENELRGERVKGTP